jgi:hypothetical protein
MRTSTHSILAMVSALYNLQDEGSSTGVDKAFAGETDTVEGVKIVLTKADAKNVNLLQEQIGASKLDILRLAVLDAHDHGMTVSESLATGEELVSMGMGIGNIQEGFEAHDAHDEILKPRADQLQGDYLLKLNDEAFHDDQWAFNDSALEGADHEALPLCNGDDVLESLINAIEVEEENEDLGDNGRD